MPFATAKNDTLTWESVVGTPAQVVAIIVAAVVVRWVAHRAIDRATSAMQRRAQERATSGPVRSWVAMDERQRQRAATIGSLLKSATSIVVLIVTVLTIAAQLGIALAPLMASAGVAGVAVGFGAQSLVKDVVSGLFMMFEDQYGVGDVIDTGEAIGTVEEVTLRVTRLRDADGVVWYVRNGEIIRVANRSQGWATSLVDLPVSLTNDFQLVTKVLTDTVQQMFDDPEWQDKLLELPSVAGVESVTSTAATFRVIAKTHPGENLAVSRHLRERSLQALAEAGVKAPPVAFSMTGALPTVPKQP